MSTTEELSASQEFIARLLVHLIATTYNACFIWLLITGCGIEFNTKLTWGACMMGSWMAGLGTNKSS